MKAKLRNLILMSFDQEDTLTCQRWSADINFDFGEFGVVKITKDLEYSRVECRESWKTMIDYGEDESGIKTRQREVYFFNFVTLFCNLCCFYFIVSQITKVVKYNMLEQTKQTKARWIAQRNNAVDFKQFRTLQRPDFPEDSSDDGQFIDLPLIVLMLSNSCLLMANVLIILSLTSMNISEYNYNEVTNIFLGIGCCLCWMNMLTVVSTIETLALVARSIKKTFMGIIFLLIGVMPVYFAFLFGGYCMFHEHEKFNTLIKTNATLSAILAGDEILDFILALISYGRIGLIYAMGFCILFVVCIHNVFIYVVTETFKDQAAKLEKSSEKKNPDKQQLKRRGTKLSEEDNLDRRTVDLYRKSAISSALVDSRVVIGDTKIMEKIKRGIFNKIIPDSRDEHIIDMNLKKDMIKDDIHFMKESMQNLLDEQLEEGIRTHLLMSSGLYIDFLIRRLNRLSKSLIENEEGDQLIN